MFIGKYNSKNYAFNIGYCSCNASVFHGKECVGKLECEDFERGNASPYVMEAKKDKKGKASRSKKTNSQTSKVTGNDRSGKKKKKGLPSCGVKVGDSITVKDVQTDDEIDLSIFDPNNQFVGKILGRSVEINHVVYKIIRVNDKYA